MAAPSDRGPSYAHTHERMLRLVEIVVEMDRIELRLEEIEAAQAMRFKTIPRGQAYHYKYRCPACSNIVESERLLKANHHHICPSCGEVVELKIILLHPPHQESDSDENPET